MTYLVTWPLGALSELQRLEAEAPDPAAVRTASGWIDYTLRRTPLDVGESRDMGRRVWYGDVLGVYYRVDTDAMTVRVIGIAPARRPKS